MKIKPVNLTITRKVILNQIGEHLAAVKQWSEMKCWNYASEYSAKAEALIEMLEVDDCGSIGGYDSQRGQESISFLQDRYKWLKSLE